MGEMIDEGYENPYRVEGLYYIAMGMEVPEELKQKIKEFDEQHKKWLESMKRKSDGKGKRK